MSLRGKKLGVLVRISLLSMLSVVSFADDGHRDDVEAPGYRPPLVQDANQINTNFNAEVDACVNKRVQSESEFQKSVVMGLLKEQLLSSKTKTKK